ncbi:hypothetical protein, partial [Pseudoalteromonas piscicida]|uniref:hypothetical protein n=1 Tax=Pseudoalteromonas piscicida TaxID=43662 RepID=UPI00110A1A46
VTIEQIQVDAAWFKDSFDICLVSVLFGADRTEQSTGGYEAWSGLRGGPGFNPSFKAIFPASMFTRHDTGDVIDQFAGRGRDLQPGDY